MIGRPAIAVLSLVVSCVVLLGSTPPADAQEAETGVPDSMRVEPRDDEPVPLFAPGIDEPTRSARRGAGETDLRGLERLVYRCTSSLGLRDVTLFGNGTVRLLRRQRTEPGVNGPSDLVSDRLVSGALTVDRGAGDGAAVEPDAVRSSSEPPAELRLDELTPEQLRDVLERLEAVRRTVELPTDSTRGRLPQGPWVERCSLDLRLADVPPLRFELGAHEVPPLGVARLIEIADELASFTRPPLPPVRLPADYSPRPGDVLRRADGTTARVVKRTDDGAGVELENLQQPTRVFYRIDDLRMVFVAVDARRPDLFGVD